MATPLCPKNCPAGPYLSLFLYLLLYFSTFFKTSLSSPYPSSSLFFSQVLPLASLSLPPSLPFPLLLLIKKKKKKNHSKNAKNALIPQGPQSSTKGWFFRLLWWPPSCPPPLTGCGLILMTGRANWGISHVVGQGGGWEGRSWMQEVEDKLFQIFPNFGLSSGRKTNCLLDITKPKEFYQIGRKDVGWQSG